MAYRFVYNIPKIILIVSFFCCLSFCFDDEFHEELLIKPLPNGQLYLNFQFTTVWNKSNIDFHDDLHFHLFPKSLGEILAKYSVQEMHLSMTQGLWRYANWGYPIYDAPPGSELWVWFQPSVTGISKIWAELNSALSGQFCASLNFMDAKSTIVPKWSFRPQGATHRMYNRLFRHARYAALPREIVCTENLTPWKKLLPCSSKAGLSTLFNAVKLYDSHYHSLGLHVRPVCRNSECSDTSLELVQSLAVVFDVPAKNYGKADWSFNKIFGRMLASSCPLASTSFVYVDETNRKGANVYHITPEPTRRETVTRGGERRTLAVFDVREVIGRERVVNIAAKFDTLVSFRDIKPPPVYAHRYLTGYGQEKGGITTQIYNNHNEELKIILMEIVPWYIQLFLHTLKIKSHGSSIKPDKVHYEPGRERQKSYHLELVFTLPPLSVTTVSINFERALLKWTEYPPDANHGFYINSAVISTVLPNGKSYIANTLVNSRIGTSMSDNTSFFIQLHTESLLVSLPTPDFSMPYNVICLASTVVAIAFGSIHNMTTRRFVIADENAKPGLLARLKSKFSRKQEKSETKNDEDTEKKS